jgi:FkbM family methyltransferase
MPVAPSSSAVALPYPIRATVRKLLRAWSRSGRASGYLSQSLERWGPGPAGELVRTTLPNGCSMICDLSDYVQQQIYFLGVYEPQLSHAFVRVLRPGMVVVDAGANVGQHTLLASTAVGEGGSVHSFEPVPQIFENLSRHVAMNGLRNVHLNRAALWSDETELALGLPAGHDGNKGAYSVRAAARESTAVIAPAIRLDTYVAAQKLTCVDAVKMDVEGAEPFAIRGARETLREFSPLIFVEVYREGLIGMGSSPQALWDELGPLGYRAWEVGYSPAQVRQLNSFDDITLANVLLTRGDLPAELASGWTVQSVKRWARSGW